MKLRYLFIILVAVGAWYYFNWYNQEPPPPPPVVQKDPGKAKHARALIYFHERRIEDLENQNWRQRRGSGSDTGPRLKRNEEIAKLRKEIAKLQGEAAGD